MRSKEVEEAIEKTKRIRTGLMNFNELLDDNIVVINGIDKVLNYIEELENVKSPYFIPKAIIRIKIEEYKKKIQELYNKDLWVEPDYTILKLKCQYYIEVLESLLGE